MHVRSFFFPTFFVRTYLYHIPVFMPVSLHRPFHFIYVFSFFFSFLPSYPIPHRYFTSYSSSYLLHCVVCFVRVYILRHIPFLPLPPCYLLLTIILAASFPCIQTSAVHSLPSRSFFLPLPMPLSTCYAPYANLLIYTNACIFRTT